MASAALGALPPKEVAVSRTVVDEFVSDLPKSPTNGLPAFRSALSYWAKSGAVGNTIPLKKNGAFRRLIASTAFLGEKDLSEVAAVAEAITKRIIIKMDKHNGLSNHSYGTIIWAMDQSICMNKINRPTRIDTAIVALREDFLNRVSKNQRMRLPIGRRDDSDSGPTVDILRNRNLVVKESSLPFRDRKIPNVHIDWLLEQIKLRGLSKALESADFFTLSDLSIKMIEQ